MSKERDALKLALEALETCIYPQQKQLQAITVIKEALAQPAPPPPECKTEAEQTAFAFGWWKALESVRTKQAAQEPVYLIQTHKEGNWCNDLTCKKCYSADFRFKHQKRRWVNLTDEQIAEVAEQGYQRWKEFARAIDIKLKELNT